MGNHVEAKENLIHVHLHHPGREEIDLKLWVSSEGVIQKSQLSGIGAPELLDLLEQWRPKLVGDIYHLETPQGEPHSPGSLLLREALLKAIGKWNFPIKSEYLCHCRSVKTTVVDQAIVRGAHTPQEVTRRTSASTGCGTCQPDVEAMIHYRLAEENKENESA